MSAQNVKLLNPGPVTLTERVRKALLEPDMCHREAELEFTVEEPEPIVHVKESIDDEDDAATA